MLKSYFPGVNTSIFPKKHYEDIFYEKLVNELHAWIENQPHVINTPNAKDSLFIKINGIFVNIQKHILQISVREVNNNMILPNSEGVFFGARTVYGKVYIGYT